MAYLITHIAIFLVFAQLLGLLLGWLLWGYVARQRGHEVQSLRERIASMHVASARLAAVPEPQVALPEATGVLIEGDLPEAETFRGSFFEEEAEPLLPPQAPAKAVPVANDLESEVRESRLQHLEQQIRELEGVRDRLPLLQADLSDALAGRRMAESKFQEAKNDFEVRSSSLQMQVRELESAAKEWEREREEFASAQLAKEKELSTVKAHLRDLQNSQRPQSAEPVAAAPSVTAIELADLRDRHQRAIRERDSIAEELEFWKQNDTGRSNDSTQSTQRVAELEESVRTKDANLQQQVARIESLLWRVAELEPFAASAPQLEEDLKRQESEIAGHMAMHLENAEQIRSLQNRAAELETTVSEMEAIKAQAAAHVSQLETATQKIAALEKSLSEHDAAHSELMRKLDERTAELERMAAASEALKQRAADYAAEIQRLHEDHASRLEELQQSLKHKEGELAEQMAGHMAAQQAHENTAAGLRARISELEAVAARVGTLEKSLRDRDTEIAGLLSAHSDMRREMEGWKEQSAQLQPLASRLPGLESTLNERDAEITRLKAAHTDKDSQLTSLHERLNAVSARLSWHQQRLFELEPVAAKVPELARREEESRQQLKAQEEKHQAELTQLKVNSAHRLRRLRQGMTNFKG